MPGPRSFQVNIQVTGEQKAGEALKQTGKAARTTARTSPTHVVVDKRSAESQAAAAERAMSPALRAAASRADQRQRERADAAYRRSVFTEEEQRHTKERLEQRRKDAVEAVYRKSVFEGDRIATRAVVAVRRREAAETAAADRRQRSAAERLGFEGPIRGPMQRMERARAMAGRATTEQERIDAAFQLARAQRQLDRSRRRMAGGMGQFLGEAVLSRAGMGGAGAMDTARQFMESGGISGLGVVRAGLVIGAVVTALSAVAYAANAASRNLSEMGTGQRLSGGNAFQTGALSSVGLRGAEMANRAGSLRQNMSTNPMAMMFAARMGIRAVPEPFGTTNNAVFMTSAVEGLKKLRTEEEKLRAARVLQIEDLLKYTNLSKDMEGRLQYRAALESQLYNKQATRRATEMDVAKENVSRGWQNLMTAFGGRFQPMMLAAARNMGGNLNAMAARVAGVDPKRAMSEYEKALRENTAATQELTGSMRRGGVLGPGMYGAGTSRAGQIVPEGWRGGVMDRVLEEGAIRRGDVIP